MTYSPPTFHEAEPDSAFVPKMPLRGRRRGGFSMVELLVVVVLIATLLALLLPAIYSAREASYRVHCQSNLRNIGQALLQYESGRGRFPYGRNEGEGYYDHSWATLVLPHLEEQALFDRYDFSRPWDDDNPPLAASSAQSPGNSVGPLASTAPQDSSSSDNTENTEASDEQSPAAVTNFTISQTDLPIFQCPAIAHEFKGAIDYGGNYGTTLTGLEDGFYTYQGWSSGVLIPVNLQRMGSRDVRKSGVRQTEISDGAAHTFLVLEDAGRPAWQGGQWASGHNCFSHDRPYINIHRSNEIYSKHAGLAHALMADGTLMVVSDEIDREVLGALLTRAGGERVENDE